MGLLTRLSTLAKADAPSRAGIERVAARFPRVTRVAIT